jgi:hypothetical protein
MRINRLLVYPAFALAMFLLEGCGDTVVEPSSPEARGGRVGTDCVAGCLDPDPDVTYPGVFLSTAVTPAKCFANPTTGVMLYTDRDQDKVGDRCENDIAAAFVPTFRHSASDNVGHESYWAVNRVGTTSYIRVLYMIGYYFDDGVQEGYSGCKLVSLWQLLGECDGHHGDSEHVAFTVYYHAKTGHWLIHSMHLSHHGGYLLGTRSSLPYPSGIQYTLLGARPIIWVADGKHANYPSQAACDAGTGGGFLVDAIFSFDTCEGNNGFFTLTAPGSRNVGSARVRLIDCVASTNQFYATNPKECFWSSARFIGWQLDRTTWATGYRKALDYFTY